VSSEAITAIFTGLTGLIAALAAFMATRNRRITMDQGILRRRVRQLERQVLALSAHTFALELEIARHGGRVPDRPLILEQLHADTDTDPDDEAGAAPDPPRAAGRHAIRPE
jgi:hypothetical protein